MKPGRFIFIIVILLSYSLNSTAAPVNTGNAQPIPTYDEAWMNSYLPSGVTMKGIRDWQADMPVNVKRRYQDDLEKEINLFSQGKGMTTEELLVLRIQCQGNQFIGSQATNPYWKSDEEDLKKIFRPGLTQEENEENARLFKSLDDGDDPAEEKWKNSLLPPHITIKDIHSWEASLNDGLEKMHCNALRRSLLDLTKGKEIKPKDFKALLIRAKKRKFLKSRHYQNRKFEKASEDKLLPQDVTMAMVKNWEDTMSEEDKEIYSKTLNDESNRLKREFSATIGFEARLLKFRGRQYVMAQKKRRHANPLTPAQKEEITTWIENLNLKEFPPEADDARTDAVLSPDGVTMEIIRQWEADILWPGHYKNVLKKEMMAWMADEIPLSEIQRRSILSRGQRCLKFPKRKSIKRREKERSMGEATGTQPPNSSRGNFAPPKRTATTPIHGELLNTSNASPRIASSAPFDNANSSRGDPATPPTKRTKYATEETPIHGEPANTPNVSPSIAHSPLPVTLPVHWHVMIDADNHAPPPHPEHPPGTISLKDLEKYNEPQ
ncbi:hypothetical protein H0H93_005669 [Arthromyces matolae]|nr:hypothetical protein H0H93_005669 [Arthromyces matolae]